MTNPSVQSVCVNQDQDNETLECPYCNKLCSPRIEIRAIGDIVSCPKCDSNITEHYEYYCNPRLLK